MAESSPTLTAGHRASVARQPLFCVATAAAGARFTIMFCAFDNPAPILRLYGRGRAVLSQDDAWEALALHCTLLPGTPQIVVVAVEQVQTSCGWGVPRLAFEHERATLDKYHAASPDSARFGEDAVRTTSSDELPVRNPTMVPA